VYGGEITLKGQPYRPSSPRRAMDRGLGLAPEDRKLEGLMTQMSVKENASLSVLPRLHRLGFLGMKKERSEVERVGRRMAVKAASLDAPVGSLSGGNQQKVLLGRWLMVDPDVYFLDDPTRGVDIGAKHDIYGIIEDLTNAGKGVLLVSSELPELLRCCHRILVLHGGYVMGIVDAATTTQERIMTLATRSIEPEAIRTGETNQG
jgi:ABC-type sugar transport system ATPase subunit